MGYTICIGNQKGGTGKTTTAICLSSALAIAEKKTLLVDSDPQGHSTIGIVIEQKHIRRHLYHGLIGETGVNSLILDSELNLLKVIPSQIELFRAESEIHSMSGKEYLLRNLIKDVKDEYEYIVIDSPSSLNLLTVNALSASDSLLIPLQCGSYAIESLGQLFKIFNIIKKNFNPAVRISGILLTMFDKDDGISIQIKKKIKSFYKEMLLKTIIPCNNELRESAYYGKPLLMNDIQSAGARSYLKLAEEIMNSE